MKQESRRRMVWGWLFTVTAAVLLVSVAFAQEPPPKKPAAEPKASSTQTVKKFRGRLPMYYGKVVSDKQRTEIYGIQEKYSQQIIKLQEELEALTAKRDAEVEQVLTDEQRAEVTKLKEARTARRSSTEETDTANK